MKKSSNGKFITVTCLSVAFCSLFGGIQGQTESSNPLPQFLFREFTKGILKMKDGRQMAATLNYNMVDEEMIFDQKGVYMALDKPEEIDTVYIQNRKFVPVEKAFYEVLTKGPVEMFIQHKSRYTQKGTPTAYGMTTKTAGPSKVLAVQVGNQVRQIDLLEDVDVSPATLYWVKAGNKMDKFTNERQFLKLFPDHEAELKEFIKTNKLDFKSREDLIRLGDFCNQIVK